MNVIRLFRRLCALLRDLPETDCSRHEAWMRLAKSAAGYQPAPRRAPLIRLAEDYPRAWVSKALRRIFHLEAAALPPVATKDAARIQSIRKVS